MTEFTIFDRWISNLRRQADYIHDLRKSGKTIVQPDIDDICNEMEAYKTGRINMFAEIFNDDERRGRVSNSDDFPLDPNAATVDLGEN